MICPWALSSEGEEAPAPVHDHLTQIEKRGWPNRSSQAGWSGWRKKRRAGQDGFLARF
jgi:hypothetical protein